MGTLVVLSSSRGKHARKSTIFKPLSNSYRRKMATKKLIRVSLPLVILLLMICAATNGNGATRSRKPSGTVLTGKFIAQVDGPPLTGFGSNQKSYVFEMLSPFGSQFVRISDTFLIYQSHVPGRILDYSKVYKVTAVRNQKCDETLEDISRRFIFDSRGQFVEMKFALTYAKNLPSFTLPWQSPLPCYVVSTVQPPAQVATEATPQTAAH